MKGTDWSAGVSEGADFVVLITGSSRPTTQLPRKVSRFKAVALARVGGLLTPPVAQLGTDSTSQAVAVAMM